MKTTGLQQLGTMKFDRLQVTGDWEQTIGKPTRNFSCIIYGTSGNGKTTAIIDFLKVLCDLGLRATYISHEEGISGTMQDAFGKAGMLEDYSGKVILGEDATFEETLEYFSKRGSPEIAVIDSVDYCNLTKEQYQELRKKLSKKIIILISWSQGSRPKTQAARDIEYMVDIKLHVKNFMIWPKSRFGGNTPKAIWEERARHENPKYFMELDKRTKQTLFTAKPAIDALAIDAPAFEVHTGYELQAKECENNDEMEGVDAND